MTIPTQMSLLWVHRHHPQLTFTGDGTARFHARAGVEHWRKEPDETFTRLESTFHTLVVYGKTAERAYVRIRVGDNFVASGHVHLRHRPRRHHAAS